MRIEKGIREVRYQTKDGTQIKYRVRVKTKTFEADKLFDDPKQARDYLSLIKSKDGQKAVTEFSEKAKMAEEAMSAYLQSATLENYLNGYYKKYFHDESTDTKKRSSYAKFCKIKSICNTRIKVNQTELKGRVTIMRQYAKGNEWIRFGDMKIEDINEQTTSDWIDARLKTVKKVTVKGEIAVMQAFFNKLRYIDKPLSKRLENNPFAEADKSLVQEFVQKRKRRLSEDEEERLYKSLCQCVNPEMMQIVVLAVVTGMRKGEILALEWENIGKHVITLTDAKKGPREVVLSDEAKAVIETVAKRDKKLFHYTSDGFDSNWDRAKKRAKIENFRFHDTRREFISRIVDKISSPIAIAELSTLKDAAHIENYYLKPLREEKEKEGGIKTIEQAMRSIGHQEMRTTSIYYTRKKGQE